jgi:hypothetical protein
VLSGTGDRIWRHRRKTGSRCSPSSVPPSRRTRAPVPAGVRPARQEIRQDHCTPKRPGERVDGSPADRRHGRAERTRKGGAAAMTWFLTSLALMTAGGVVCSCWAGGPRQPGSEQAVAWSPPGSPWFRR